MSPSKLSVKSSGPPRPRIVIEHLETTLGRWLLLEYKHALEIAKGNIAITNAGDLCRRLRQMGFLHCFRESVLALRGRLYTRADELVVLDPLADKAMEPSDVSPNTLIVVGGILGDHPPRGRTWKLLTKRALSLGARARNLGHFQLSIDGAVYVALEVAKGKHLRSIPLIQNPTFKKRIGDTVIEITLPYAYPLVNGKPLLAPGLLDFIEQGLGYEEYKLLLKDVS